MQIGDTVTWKELVRTGAQGQRARFTTGVIVGERVRGEGRELRIAVECYSGAPPAKPTLLTWVSAMTVLCGRTSPAQHVRKVTPQALIERRQRKACRSALAAAKAENECLRLALSRAGVRA